MPRDPAPYPTPGPLLDALLERMDPDPAVRAAIRAHLGRQRGVAAGRVRLDDGRDVPIGEGGDDDN